jgi:NitT/TauT family transport system ATP-binding protein
MIRVDNVTKVFVGRRGATVEALRDIDIDVEEGEFVAAIGRSGCGKSTLLRLMAGLLPATRGQILLAGTPVHRPLREVAMLFQRPALLPWRTVLDNVLLPVEVFGWSRGRYRAHAHELLEMVGLYDFRGRLPHELSGGMQQRVALCRALIARPKVLLMDEPFSALDALTRAELAVELQRIHMDLGATIVFVTHSVQEAVLLADRVAVLTQRPGRVREIVPVDIPRPRSFGLNAHLDEVAATSAELHDLLLTGEPDQHAEPSREPSRVYRRAGTPTRRLVRESADHDRTRND